ncbi:MAG TPA: GldG family protein [Candidatus Acidoferrum sp.]|nr:GldG family protein [Candidatus Acidoferrum sp.]
MSAEFLKARQSKYAAYAATYIAVVLTIIAALNVLANRYEKSFDTTANKRYSLSDQTVKIVKGLKQDATITYFDGPRGFQSARDQLDLYSNLSPKVHVKFVDPDKDPMVARAAGFKSNGTAIVQVGLNKNEAKSVTEEEITGALIRDLKNTTRTVCFVTGSGEHQIDDSGRSGYSRLKDLLGKDNYTAKSIDLLQKAEVPADCTVLVIAGPSGDYQQPEVDAIKKYVEDGGRALFLLDPPLKMGRSEIADNDALTSVLSAWGVTVDKDLILDLNPIGQLTGLGPQVALVTKYESHPIVSEMKGSATGFPLSRSLDIKTGGAGKASVQKLFESSDSSLATDKLHSPKIDPNDPKNRKGPLTIAAAGTYSNGKENSQGRFVVIGSSEWAANSFLPFNGNRDLALNAMNWLSSDEDLISIRPKEPEDRRITMTNAQFRGVMITSQFVLPLLVIFAGVSVWWRRR